jgi:spore coat polysaccharide biosynthesis protein SpsF (cytidylyltransferase family)/aryl-alcohol dehydrogenase-like predicted oxidoreductase
LKTVTVIQARTSSSRLPAKALLPVAGYPSAVLAALRAANHQHTTILAIPDDACDDELARQAQNHGLKVFRGPQHDVLGRYYLACSSLPNDCAVVRLTADNVIPDGQFVAELTAAFASAGTDYMHTESSATGLPYGLGGEIFTAAALRRAHREATSPGDREHVGPWIKRNCSTAVYRPRVLEGDDYSYLRCTIDDEEDYRRIQKLFDPVGDALKAGWLDLLHRLAQLPGEPTFHLPHRIVAGRRCSQMTLGTAQLGMEYGIVNDDGKPSPGQAVAIVRKAIAHGVAALDTAGSYGTAEEVVGKALEGAWASRVEVITKLDLSRLPDDASEMEVRAEVDNCVVRSCRALGLTNLTVLLLHRWQDHNSWEGVAWRHLLELRAEGKIGVLGASVYRTDEALAALEDSAVGHLQIPLNVLDWRWEAAGVDRAAASRPDVMVHARSALLQGILAHPARRWPPVESFPSEDCVRILEKLAEVFGRRSVADLCLAYVRSLPWVDSVVVGCETMEQLDENLLLFRTPELSRAQGETLRRELPRAPEDLLNPSKWKVHERCATR